MFRNRNFIKATIFCIICFAALLSVNNEAIAHGVTLGDKGYIKESGGGTLVIPFIYLGAKHMITGYDHLLFLVGVIFFLYRMKDISKYVTYFAVGHIITLLGGVFFNISISAYIIDAIIGLSVVYKGLDNLGAFKTWFGIQPDKKKSTLIFGLFHGLGLATKLLEYDLPKSGLYTNLVSFNVGVELGQILALGMILILMTYWRKTSSFYKHAYLANVVLMIAGFILMGYQIAGFITYE